MKVIKLNGKKIKLQSTFFANRELLKKYNFKDPDKKWTPDEEDEFLLDAVWLFMKPRAGIKPFITFNRFIKRADLQDIKTNMMNILSVVHGIDLDSQEDGDRGNVKTLRSKSG